MIDSEWTWRLAILANLIERAPRSLVEMKSIRSLGPNVVFEPSDEFAAAHYQVLCHEMMPAASVFLEPGSVMGSFVSDRAWTTMWTAGYEPDTSSILADHLSSSLRFTQYLLENGRLGEVHEFLQREVLSWLPVFLDRLGRFDIPEMTDLGRMMEEVVDHILDAPAKERGPFAQQGLFPALPASDFHLEDERTNLVAISEFLASHAACGLFMTKSALVREARLHRLPTGFGSRARTIEGMLRSAAQYDALGAVCDFFDGEIGTHRATWDRWETKGAAHWAAEWRQRLDGTQEVVRQLRQAESKSV